MALIVKKTAPVHTPAPAGLHHATCIRIIDLGTQKTDFAGKTKRQPKIMIVWELCGTDNGEGRPHIAAKRYTASLNEKAALAIDLGGWTGKAAGEEIDLTEMLGKSCAINIIHKPSKDGSRVYTEVQSISPPMKGFTAPQPHTAPAAFDLTAPDWTLFAELSDYTRDTIAKSPEYAALENRPPDTPEPVKEALPEIKMSVDDALFALLAAKIKKGEATAAQIYEMGYDLTEAQRLELENI